ncbi:M15 family metallopeptidase [Massilia sp. CF038]|uniref:M15 family metallopeptidase n=1 Tax=Massilia sp. CF038 TaxID=1881045 RepID=UPI0009200A2E|nr:M15 family metallopeptidase [Massilia sp. CF038]SHH62805.1 D-alanyl-D-alanine carboxypeptidase [Massilia sp. CF038]
MLDSGELIKEYTNGTKLAVRTPLNIRSDPSRSARKVRQCAPPAILVADRLVDAEAFLDNSLWYRESGTGNFFWAGGVDDIAPASLRPGASKPNVLRRPDGTIKPLGAQVLQSKYGTTAISSNTNGTINLDPAWRSANISQFQHMLLAQMDVPHLWVNAQAIAAFQAVFDAIAAAGPGFGDRLLTCGGAFVPRHIGRNPARPISSHTWGVAIDLNVEWNGYGVRPQGAGLIGSVREIQPFFADFGFAWGGHFSGSSCDGMHFELAIQ